MGTCCSDDSVNIETPLATADVNKDYKKILFLGTGNSAKATLFKQIQYLYGSGFDIHDKLALKEQIYSQIISEMQHVIKYFNFVNDTSSNKLQNATNIVLEYNDFTVFGAEIADSIQYIWKNDERLNDIFNWNGWHTILYQTTQYFWNNIDRIKHTNYIPNYEDIIRVRHRTTGVIEGDFEIDNQQWFVYTTGGQKSERKKWIRYFDSVDMMVYMVNLSSFNQNLYEDHQKNCMVDSIELFEQLINGSYFVNSHIVLIFSMIDIFEQKIKKQIAITECSLFTDYNELIYKYQYIVFIICDHFMMKNKNVIIPTNITNLIASFCLFGLNVWHLDLIQFDHNIQLENTNIYGAITDDTLKYYIKYKFEEMNRNKDKQIHVYFMNMLNEQHVRDFVKGVKLLYD